MRRAAASAFQEAVGRLGGALPHGLDLLEAVDCFSVANMGAAYLVAAPQVIGWVGGFDCVVVVVVVMVAGVVVEVAVGRVSKGSPAAAM